MSSVIKVVTSFEIVIPGTAHVKVLNKSELMALSIWLIAAIYPNDFPALYINDKPFIWKTDTKFFVEGEVSYTGVKNIRLLIEELNKLSFSEPFALGGVKLPSRDSHPSSRLQVKKFNGELIGYIDNRDDPSYSLLPVALFKRGDDKGYTYIEGEEVSYRRYKFAIGSL